MNTPSNTPISTPEKQRNVRKNAETNRCPIRRVQRGRPLGRKNNKTLKLNEKGKIPFSIMSGFVPDNCQCSSDCEILAELEEVQSELGIVDKQLEELLQFGCVMLDNKKKDTNTEENDTNNHKLLVMHSTTVIQDMKKRLDANFERCINKLGKCSTQEFDCRSVLRNLPYVDLLREIVFNTPPIFRFSEFLEKASSSYTKDITSTLNILDNETFFQKIRTGNDSIYIKETRLRKIEASAREKKMNVINYISAISMGLPELSELVRKFDNEEVLFSRFPEARDCLVNFWIFAILKHADTNVLMSEFPKTFKETIDMGINELEHEGLIKFESVYLDRFTILKDHNKVLHTYGLLIN